MQLISKKNLFYYAIQTILVIAIAITSFHLYAYDLRVPFSYSGDSVIILMYIKGLMLNGWTYTIPQLSAPYEMNAVAFPILTSFDWVIMKGITLFTNEPGVVLNLFWLLTLVLSAWSATISLNALGINRKYSLAAGVLYAFLPFALLRNVAHLNLVYYLVPFLALLAINLATGLKVPISPGMHRLVFLACIAQGFNYIYFSFFAVLLFAFAGLVGYIKTRSRSVIRVAIMAMGLIIGATVINLSPSIYCWIKNGKPPDMNYKSAPEAEIFGVKIRKMIAPHQNNPLPILHTWGQKDISASYPNENENVTARLGLAGSVGFVLLLLVSLRILQSIETDTKQVLPAVASLSLFTLLFITVGGLGATFNLLIASDIRAYNRFSVFVSFFSFAGLGCYLQQQWSVLSAKAKQITLIIVGMLISLSLYDQLLDKETLVTGKKADTERYMEERLVVNKLKKLYSSHLSVLQMPMTGFPPLNMHNKMASYDHLRPFLWSDSNIHWSWPSFSQRHRAWQERIKELKGVELLNAAVFSDFDVIWIDRFGFSDQGDELIASLAAAGGQQIALSERHTIIDITSARQKIKESLGDIAFKSLSDDWLNQVVYINWSEGFHTEEINPQGTHFRWSKNHSKISLTNISNQKQNVVFSFDLASEKNGVVSVNTGQEQRSLKTLSQPTHYQLKFDIGADSKTTIDFITNVPRVNAPTDSRELYFYLANPVVSNVEKGAKIQ